MAFDFPEPNPEKRTGYTYKGKEITLGGFRGRPLFRKLPTKAGWYSDETRTHAACIFATSGSTKIASEVAKVPQSTIKKWVNEPWWKAIQDEIRVENNSKIEAKMNQILETAVDQIADRIENGNQQLDQKTGKLISIPASLRDLTQVTATIIEKRQTILGKDGSGEGNITAIQRLENLASQFEKMVGKVKPKEVIDVEFKEIKNGNGTSDTKENETVPERDLESQLWDYQRESRIIEAIRLPEEGNSGAKLQTT